MEDTLDEVAELLGGDLALAANADAAGVTDHLADHVLRLGGRGVRMLLLLSVTLASFDLDLLNLCLTISVFP